MRADRPNILLLTCHDLGRHLGCYGRPVSTPNLDDAAREGVLFTNCFCTAAQCSPSRGSIVTGRYPHRNGLMGLAHIGWELHPGERTLPMYLAQAGYDTHLFGVQHESSEASRLGYGQVHPGDRDAGTVARAVSEFLRQAAPGRPFFISTGTVEPHRPYQREGYPRDDPARVQPLPYLPDRPGIREDLAGLHGLIWVLDEAVGEILAALRETGHERDTLFVFTTDHGLAMPRAKGTCYDPGIETALIMRWPGRLPAGETRDDLLVNVDLLPTLLEVAGAPTPADLDGRSFLPLVTGGEYRPHERIFLEMTWHDKYNPMRGVRTRTRKYVRSFGDRPLVYLPLDIYRGRAGEEVREDYYGSSRPEEELYDLERDPLEQHNLHTDPAYADDLRELRGWVQEWRERTGDPLLAGPVPPPERQRQRAGEPNDWPRPG